MGVRRGDRGAFVPLDFEIQHFPIKFQQKGCFLSFEWLKWNFGTFAPTCKNFLATPGKCTIGPTQEKNPFDALVSGSSFSLSSGWEKRERSVWVHVYWLFTLMESQTNGNVENLAVNHHLFTDGTVWCVLCLVQASVAFKPLECLLWLR